MGRWPPGLSFDVGVPGWRVSFVAGMCRSAWRSQLVDALDVLGVQGLSVEFLVGEFQTSPREVRILLAAEARSWCP